MFRAFVKGKRTNSLALKVTIFFFLPLAISSPLFFVIPAKNLSQWVHWLPGIFLSFHPFSGRDNLLPCQTVYIRSLRVKAKLPQGHQGSMRPGHLLSSDLSSCYTPWITPLWQNQTSCWTWTHQTHLPLCELTLAVRFWWRVLPLGSSPKCPILKKTFADHLI